MWAHRTTAPANSHLPPPRKTCHASHLSPGHWSTNKHRGISAVQQQNGHIHSAGRARDTGREGERLSQRLLVPTHRAFYWLNKRDRINQRDIDSSWRASPARRLKLMTRLMSLQLIVRVWVCALADVDISRNFDPCQLHAQLSPRQQILLQPGELEVLWFMVMWLKLITPEHQKTRWLKDTVDSVLTELLLFFLLLSKKKKTKKKLRTTLFHCRLQRIFLKKKSQQGWNEGKPCDYITVLIHVE